MALRTSQEQIDKIYLTIQIYGYFAGVRPHAQLKDVSEILIINNGTYMYVCKCMCVPVYELHVHVRILCILQSITIYTIYMYMYVM